MNHPHPEFSPSANAATVQHTLDTLPFTHHFADLGSAFYTQVQPEPLPAPYTVGYSAEVAAMLGLTASELDSPAFAETFIGNQLTPHMQPLAAVYSGHQFGMWAGQLGDGRALLLGAAHPAQHLPPLEIQLKGAGATPYSRMGDGRAVLRSSIREFLCSEAMAGLGIPTTRALSVIGSDASIRRETIETAAVVARVAPSFVRFGSFEHCYYGKKYDNLRALADYIIARFYPECLTTPQPYLAMLQEVGLRTAHLMAQWQAVGFCHGVMNTDNMSILGLTLDYGPFGFMETYNSEHICNHSDEFGRYAYNMQPMIGQWNLKCLGQTFVPLIEDAETIKDVLNSYKDQFEAEYLRLFRAKLGLTAQGGNDAQDNEFIRQTLRFMQANSADFTQFFRKLGDFDHASPNPQTQRDDFIDRAAFDAWAEAYRTRLQNESVEHHTQRRTAMNAVNPKYVLRNYLAEVAIRQAKQKDFSEVAKLLEILRHPFDEQPENNAYAALPPDWAGSLEVSCSS